MRLRKDIFSRQDFKKISRTLVTLGYIMFYGLGKFDCWATSFHPHLPYIRLWKNNFSQRPFQKISRTLFSTHQREIFYWRNSFNHENCNCKYHSNTFSEQTTVCQISFANLHFFSSRKYEILILGHVHKYKAVFS